MLLEKMDIANVEGAGRQSLNILQLIVDLMCFTKA
jgi:hypothetical protein